jgi:glutamine amidotransferase/cyclase
MASTIETPTKTIHVLDYGAGNVRSVENALKRCGYTPIFVETPAQLKQVDRLVFPGVGSFASAMQFLNESGYAEALKVGGAYL